MAKAVQLVVRDVAQIQKGFVDRIDLCRYVSFEDGHDSSGHISVEHKVGGEGLDPVVADQVAQLEKGLPHADA